MNKQIHPFDCRRVCQAWAEFKAISGMPYSRKSLKQIHSIEDNYLSVWDIVPPVKTIENKRKLFSKYFKSFFVVLVGVRTKFSFVTACHDLQNPYLHENIELTLYKRRLSSQSRKYVWFFCIGLYNKNTIFRYLWIKIKGMLIHCKK